MVFGLAGKGSLKYALSGVLQFAQAHVYSPGGVSGFVVGVLTNLMDVYGGASHTKGLLYEVVGVYAITGVVVYLTPRYRAYKVYLLFLTVSPGGEQTEPGC